MDKDPKNTPEYQDLLLKYKKALRYIRQKTNRMLEVMGTLPILADDTDDEALMALDPLGILTESFSLVLENLRQTNHRLNEAYGEIETIFNSTPAGIMIIDVETRTIVNANPAAEEILGLSKELLIGKGCCDFFCTAKNKCPVLDLNETVDRRESFMFDAKGNKRTVIKSVRGITQHNRRLLVESFIDITESKRMLEELIRNQRLESLGMLAGGIAHDFNNSLTAILGNISLALAMLPPDNPAALRLQKAESAIEKAKAMAQQILTFAKGGSPVFKRLSIGQILSESVRSALSDNDINLIVDIAKDLPEVMADEVQMRQVFQNLTINACEAMPKGGSLIVEASHSLNFKNLGDPKSYVVITFRDTGHGIPREVIEHIFDPFFTTKQTGSGLGLAIVHSIIKRHGGHIFVESPETGGTTFTILIPIKAE